MGFRTSGKAGPLPKIRYYGYFGAFRHCCRKACRNAGFSLNVSALAFIIFHATFSSFTHEGMKHHRRFTSSRQPVSFRTARMQLPGGMLNRGGPAHVSPSSPNPKSWLTNPREVLLIILPHIAMRILASFLQTQQTLPVSCDTTFLFLGIGGYRYRRGLNHGLGWLISRG